MLRGNDGLLSKLAKAAVNWPRPVRTAGENATDVRVEKFRNRRLATSHARSVTAE